MARLRAFHVTTPRQHIFPIELRENDALRFRTTPFISQEAFLSHDSVTRCHASFVAAPWPRVIYNHSELPHWHTFARVLDTVYKVIICSPANQIRGRKSWHVIARTCHATTRQARTLKNNAGFRNTSSGLLAADACDMYCDTFVHVVARRHGYVKLRK